MSFRADTLGLTPGTGMLLTGLIKTRTGLDFEKGNSDLLADKLSPLVIQRGFTSFLEYYYFLKYDAGNKDEWGRVLNVLSVPETYFWREFDQIRALTDVVVPTLLEKRRSGPLRIWSGACATGEEPLSILMALNEAGWLERVPIEVIASDASSDAIQRAQKGRFRERSFRQIPPELKAKYFVPTETEWQISSDLSQRVKWVNANLIDEEQVVQLAEVDIIFCRNVFIYFSTEAIRQTVNLFAQYMNSPGYLFVAASESLLRLTTRFELQELAGAFVYVKQ